MQIKKLNHTENIVYQVQENDSLQTVCKKFKTSPASITFYSPQKEIYHGEWLFISKANKIVHVVKPLENIYAICKKYNVSKEYIIKNNNLKTDNLFIGQKIML